MSESSFGAYVCLRRPAGSTEMSALVWYFFGICVVRDRRDTRTERTCLSGLIPSWEHYSNGMTCVRFGFFITFVVSVTALAPNETRPRPNAFAIMSASALPLRYPGSSAWFGSEEYRASTDVCENDVLGVLKERKLGWYFEETTRRPS